MPNQLTITSTKLELEYSTRQELFKFALNIGVPYVLIMQKSKSVIIESIRFQQLAKIQKSKSKV